MNQDGKLNWTERIVRMRKEVPEVGWGDFKVISVRDPAVLIVRYDWRNNSVLFVHNFDEKPRELSFVVGLPGKTSKLLVKLLTEDHSHADVRGRHKLILEGYGYRWYRASERVGGRIDVLVNASGFFPMQTYDEMSAGDFRKVVDINLTGTFLMTKAITPLMRGRGWIAFGPELFSVLVRVPGPTFSVKPRITRR